MIVTFSLNEAGNLARQEEFEKTPFGRNRLWIMWCVFWITTSLSPFIILNAYTEHSRYTWFRCAGCVRVSGIERSGVPSGASSPVSRRVKNAGQPSMSARGIKVGQA